MMRGVSQMLRPILLTSLLFVAGSAAAQFAPSRPVRLIIASAPGGGTDAIGRMLAESLAPLVRQQVIAENRAGASGVIASEELLRAAPDGLTLMIVQNGHTMNPAVFRKLPYETVRDFTPIASLARSPLVLVARSKLPVSDARQLLELGRREPAQLTFGAAEASTRLAIYLLSQVSGLPFTVVGYKGTGPTMVDVAAGHMNFTVTTIASTLAYRDRIRYLAVMAAERTELLPGVPSIREQGLAGAEMLGWWGIVGPGAMPAPLVAQLNALILQAMSSPGVGERLRGLAVEPWFGSAQTFDQHIRAEIAQTVSLATRAGIQAE